MKRKRKYLSSKLNERDKKIASRVFALFVGVVLCFSTAIIAFADDDPLAVINNFSTFVFGLIRAIGLIILGFGIVQVGLSLKSRKQCGLQVQPEEDSELVKILKEE